MVLLLHLVLVQMASVICQHLSWMAGKLGGGWPLSLPMVSYCLVV